MHGFAPRVVCSLAVLTAVAGCGAARREEPPAANVAELVLEAEHARAAGDWDLAVERFGQARERTPWNSALRSAEAEALASRAAAARESGEVAGLERAERDLRAAGTLEPDDAVLRQNLAVVLAERAARSTDRALALRLRSEALALDPELAGRVSEANPELEPLVDQAFAEIERGELDAGIDRLEGVLARVPGYPPAAELLAQALVRRGTALAASGDLAGAAVEFDRAVALYAEPGVCPADACSQARLAHRNRIDAYLASGDKAQARRALAEAEEEGHLFPELHGALLEREP